MVGLFYCLFIVHSSILFTVDRSMRNSCYKNTNREATGLSILFGGVLQNERI
jgi:hypothetical protein